MKRLTVLAVDDEALALRRVELLLRRIPGVELVGMARTVEEALGHLQAQTPDVVLLDIRLTGGDGFTVAEALRVPDAPQVVFVTAFDEYAVRAFDVSATDFLVKPLEAERLAQALEKARSLRDTREAARRAQTVEAVRAGSDEAEIWVDRNGVRTRVRASDIAWVEAERDYVRLHAAGGRHLLRRTIAAIAQELGPDFLRVSRSALVRRPLVQAFRRGDRGDYRVVLAGGTEIRVGPTYLKAVRQAIF